MAQSHGHPDRKPRRAAYALPTLFTAGNLFLGFLAVMKSIQGAMLAAAGNLGANAHLEAAAMMIGVASVLDGLDGRIARMTNTTSEFGKELDSLADVIAFGVAPAILAWIWGFQFLDTTMDGGLRDHIQRIGVFFVFLYVMCGASRLARFNITTNPQPKNPGRSDRKYFVGLPIPAGAGMVASIVYAGGAAPLQWWPYAAAWIGLIGLVSFLMISTWRYRSFKEFGYVSPRSPLTLVTIGSIIYLIWNYSQPALLIIGCGYGASGLIVRLGGVIKRKLRPGAGRTQVQHG
ncbi:MAG: CDP-diacylglycerol--serine O-phosphatidyltransferase [Acidobacteria bacterium]|nr:CDP-diacylglycerol--serine O-phosphatidyltransferase [Acidobacteriota bacterium]